MSIVYCTTCCLPAISLVPLDAALRRASRILALIERRVVGGLPA